MTVTVIDLAIADQAHAQTAIEKVASDTEAAGEVIVAMTAIPGGSLLAIVTGRNHGSGAAEQLEGFKKLRDQNAIDVFEYNEIKKRLIASL